MTVIVYICLHCEYSLPTLSDRTYHQMSGHTVERVELAQRQRESASKTETQWSSAWKR